MLLKYLLANTLVASLICGTLTCMIHFQNINADQKRLNDLKKIITASETSTVGNDKNVYRNYVNEIKFNNEYEYRTNKEVSDENFTNKYGLLQATSGILIDTDNMEILYAQNALEDRAPASTTKLLTAITALEFLDLDTPVKVGCERNFIAADSSVCGLKKGDTVLVKDLLNGLLIKSGNDAAYTLACYAGMYLYNETFIPFNENKFDGKYVLPEKYDYTKEEAIKYIGAFIAHMNLNAKEMGCKTAHFTTPDGYDEIAQRITAIDLAKICVCAKQNKTISEICNSTSYYCEALNKNWVSTNELMNEETAYYNPDVDGLKTGTTDDAGMCFVSSAHNNNKHLVSVILGGDTESRWTETNRLLKVGFAR